MALSPGAIYLSAGDAQINAIIRGEAVGGVSYTRHFNQGEDFFLKLGRDFIVPSFPIHHDVRQRHPDRAYIETIGGLIETLQRLIPDVFEGLTYVFNPAEVLRPMFFQLFRVEGHGYLYMVKLDLVCRPQNHHIVEKGTNDTTPVYRTNELIIEADIVPLSEILSEEGRTTAAVAEQLISDTWIGETGRGYFVQGIWLDADLTKFFSKLFVPAGKRIYPYYPFNSKYRSVCHRPIALGNAERRRAVPILHRVKEFLRPHLSRIEHVLREHEFSDALPEFQEIRSTVPEEWTRWLEPVTLSVY
ncbi:MAG: hypothetical protein MI724_18350, partial [Spirochaetales bacterium]|nr:hypothetical protein [Spirochaetales bacterium]